MISLQTFSLYQFNIVYLLSGLSKFAPAALLEKFPGLPKWFPYGAGVWELSMLLSYWQYNKEIAVNMSYMFLGGVFCASIYMKNQNNSTAARDTYGLILIPSSLTFFTTLQLGNELGMNPYHSIAYGAVGFIVGALIYNPKLIKSNKN